METEKLTIDVPVPEAGMEWGSPVTAVEEVGGEFVLHINFVAVPATATRVVSVAEAYGLDGIVAVHNNRTGEVKTHVRIPATAAPEYCECERPETLSVADCYAGTAASLKNGNPCVLCGKPINPVWTWRTGDPLPLTLPKGCEWLWSHTEWKPEDEPPGEWGLSDRRWPIAKNLDLEFAEPEPAAPEYCECTVHGCPMNDYRQYYRDVVHDTETTGICRDCHKSVNPTWHWHPGDPLPLTVPKGCEFWSTLDREWYTENDRPVIWGNLPRRWPIAENLDLEFAEPEPALIPAYVMRPDLRPCECGAVPSFRFTPSDHPHVYSVQCGGCRRITQSSWSYSEAQSAIDQWNRGETLVQSGKPEPAAPAPVEYEEWYDSSWAVSARFQQLQRAIDDLRHWVAFVKQNAQAQARL